MDRLAGEKMAMVGSPDLAARPNQAHTSAAPPSTSGPGTTLAGWAGWGKDCGANYS